MKISGTIKDIKDVAPDVVHILVYVGIGTVVLGILSGLSITGMPAGLELFLNTTLGTSTVTIYTALLSVLGTIISLLVVAALWKLFGLGGKKKKGNSM